MVIIANRVVRQIKSNYVVLPDPVTSITSVQVRSSDTQAFVKLADYNLVNNVVILNNKYNQIKITYTLEEKVVENPIPIQIPKPTFTTLLEYVDYKTSANNPILHNGIPSSHCFITEAFITDYLDQSRPVVNLGSFTGRDLDYILPYCKKVFKRIECLDSFTGIKNDEIKTELQNDIEAKYSSDLIRWTWADASESKYLESADYIHLATYYDFPSHDYILKTNYPCIWASRNLYYLWPKLGKAFADKKLYFIVHCGSLMYFTNSKEFVDKFRDETLPNLTETFEKYSYFYEWSGEYWTIMNLDAKEGMKYRWQIINNYTK